MVGRVREKKGNCEFGRGPATERITKRENDASGLTRSRAERQTPTPRQRASGLAGGVIGYEWTSALSEIVRKGGAGGPWKSCEQRLNRV